MRFRRQRQDRGAYSPTAGLPFDDQELETRLAWIWTTARSGSTWLLRMLSHPLRLVDSRHDDDDLLGFEAPPTWQGKVDLIPVDTTFVANHLLPLPGSADYSDDLSPMTFSSALGLRNRANYFFSAKYEDAWRPEVRRMILVRFHRFLERTAERYETNNPLLVLKEVAGAHAAPLIMSMFPNSKLVFLVRDGRDVVDSQTAANQPEGWLPVTGWRTAEERREFVRRRARTWIGDVTAIKKAFEAHPAARRTMIRYEDLLATPAESLSALIDFLGMPRNERWLERAVELNAFESIPPAQKGPTKFFRSATPGAWQQNLTAEEAAILNEEMAGKLREFGYPMKGDFERRARAEYGKPTASDETSPSPRSARDVVSAWAKKAGEGRDYSNLVRLVTKRGSDASRRERKVALTFDDGPVLRTYHVLETLERYGARGTFFLVGRKIAGLEEVIHRLLSGGHEIGNHSYEHSPFPHADDVAACTTVIEHLTGMRPKLFRPPFGAIDTPGAEAAIQKGMRVVLWSVDSEDGIPPWIGISAEEITSNVLEQIEPGSIVLLHDGVPWSRAADAIPKLIDALTSDGYELVTVSELLEGRGTPRHNERITGRLRRRGSPVNWNPAAPTASPNGTDTGRHPVDLRQRLLGMLEGVTDLLEPPKDGDRAAELIHGGREALLGSVTQSNLLIRHTAAYEVNAVLMICLGFSLRRFEGEHNSAALPRDDLGSRLSSAADPAAEAGMIAEELAEPRRHERLIAARLAELAAVSAADEAAMAGSGESDHVHAPHSATPKFLSIFAPGSEVWQQIESWARATGGEVARRRNRALLDAAGVEASFRVQGVIDRLDVDFLFRFGYALATCEEVLSPAPS